MSQRYQLDRENEIKIIKALGYSVLSALVVSLLNILPNVDFPAQWLWVVPVVNTLLVVVKQFVSEQK